MAREAALIAKNPLLIQKTIADKLSDKIQVIIAPPQAGGFFAGGLIGQRMDQARAARRADGQGERRRPRPAATRSEPMLTLTLTLVVALGDPGRDAAARAMARETAARQTQLYAGDWLEVRGERQGWLSGLRPSPRAARLRAAGAGAQLRGRPSRARATWRRSSTSCATRRGMESLGIGYAALFLRAAPASAVGGELFDALGDDGRAARSARVVALGAAQRRDAGGAAGGRGQLRRASTARSSKTAARAVCYDGEAFRRVLALPSPAAAKARAALGLTDPACVDPALTGTARETLVAWQADALEKADLSAPTASSLAPWLVNRLRIRRAAVQAELAYARARKHDDKGATAAAAAAVHELALVDKPELADDDALAYDEAAVRVGAVRAAAEARPATAARAIVVNFVPGKPGETCAQVTQAGRVLVAHCTYAVVWPSSLRMSPRGDALTIAQSPLPGWTELVIVRRGADGWTARTMAPAAVDPELGYVEAAGWSPDGTRLLVAREARMTGPLGQPNTLAPWIARSFQIVRADDLVVEKQAAHLDNFVSFRRWATPDWHRSTLALR